MTTARNILLVTTIALLLIGLSYAMAAQQVFGETARIDAYLMEFVPEECKVVDASRGVSILCNFFIKQLDFCCSSSK